MKCVLIEAIKRAVKKMGNNKQVPKNIFNDEFVNVPSNNLHFGELKLVHNSDRKISTSNKVDNDERTERNKRRIDKEEFIKNAIMWGNELTMSDEEYRIYYKTKSLNERMDKSNMRLYK